MRVFLSYSHQDEAWKDRISRHLRVLGDLEVWDDRQIALGTDWLPAIEQALAVAGLAVLVVSADFLTSDFILRREIPPLLERRQAGGLVVVPVIARPCAWQAVPWLARIQCYPKAGRPLAEVGKARAERDLAELALKVRELLPARPAPSGRPFPRERLREELTARFDSAELKAIVYDLAIDWEDLPGATKGERVVELLRRMERRGETEALLDAVERHRPGFRSGLTATR